MDLSFLKVTQPSEETFKAIAEKLFFECALEVNGAKRWVFTELEFYFFTNRHEDPFVHKDEAQTHFGKWYFHGSGLDLTIGSPTENDSEAVYGGILIRGIRQVFGNKEFISGPLNSLKEIFSAMDSVDKPNSICLVQSEEGKRLSNETSKAASRGIRILASARVGLNENKERSKENEEKEGVAFFKRNYRFLSHLEGGHPFQEKEKVAKRNRTLFENDPDLAKEVFGYRIKF